MLILSIIYVSIICLIYRYELILFELFCVGKKEDDRCNFWYNLILMKLVNWRRNLLILFVVVSK